jgi:hypothetical protein
MPTTSAPESGNDRSAKASSMLLSLHGAGWNRGRIWI